MARTVCTFSRASAGIQPAAFLTSLPGGLLGLRDEDQGRAGSAGGIPGAADHQAEPMTQSHTEALVAYPVGEETHSEALMAN